MEFKSQICTTIEQSKKLLELGLKKETADMRLIPYSEFSVPMKYNDGFFYDDEDYTPSWSLHRLIEICPEFITINEYADTPYWFKLEKHNNKIIYENDYDRWLYLGDGDTLFNTLIDCIEWLINNKHFKQEYLNK